MRSTAVISSKGQIVIPAELRRKYRLNEVVAVSFHEEHGRLILEPNHFSAVYALQGAFRKYSLEKTLNEERRAEREREDREDRR